MKKFIPSIVFVIITDLIIYLAFTWAIYKSDGYVAGPVEILFTVPICFFWIFWSLCFFYCAYGIQKEYRNLYHSARMMLPERTHHQLRRLSITELTYKYSKTTILMFLFLPFAVFFSKLGENIDFSFKVVVILLIPFVIDLSIYLISRKLRTTANN